MHGDVMRLRQQVKGYYQLDNIKISNKEFLRFEILVIGKQKSDILQQWQNHLKDAKMESEIKEFLHFEDVKKYLNGFGRMVHYEYNTHNIPL